MQPATWLPQHDDDDDDQHQLRSPDDVVLHWQQVVHHGLISPLMDDWSHRVHGAVQDEQVTALPGRQATTALKHQGTIIDLQDDSGERRGGGRGRGLRELRGCWTTEATLNIQKLHSPVTACHWLRLKELF
jgi:hypothetical protein